MKKYCVKCDKFFGVKIIFVHHIAIFYVERGGKSLEKQLQDRKKDSEEVIKQNSVIVRRRKKFLKMLKELETMLKIETEDKEVV